tara:strand:+ start:6788 stop:6961 length:174 start_codon:yes stop_codon:yes gene_type:complete
MIRPHVEEGRLVLIGGVVAGIILSRVDGYRYRVLAEGLVHIVHRDDMVLVDSDDVFD